MVIYKYQITGEKMEFEWRKDSRVIHVDAQGNKSYMWVEHVVAPEISENNVKRTFLIKVTGDPFKPTGLTHAGTWQVGEFVFHLYEITIRRNDALR